jgi:heme-degrading monooxygenase HmoA
MIEVNKTYDFLPGIDQQAYGELAQKGIRMMLQAPGIVELRGHRNMLSSRQVRLTTVWETLADWAKFAESAERQVLESELRAFTTNINIELWGPSPVLPEPLRPGK